MGAPRRGAAIVAAAAILAAGTGLAVIESARHRASVQAQVEETVHQGTLALQAELTQLSRQSRTLAAASRGEQFVGTTAAIMAEDDRILGALLIEAGRVVRLALPGPTGLLLRFAGIEEGMELYGDDVDPSIEAALDAVLDDGELRMAGPLGQEGIPVTLGLLADRAPAVDNVPDERVLVTLLQFDRMLAPVEALADPDAARPLTVGLKVDGGVDGGGIAPSLVRGTSDLWDDGVVADASTAGILWQVAARPAAGWPTSSPASLAIMLPTAFGAALAGLQMRRRASETERMHHRVAEATADLAASRAREKAAIDHSPDGLVDVVDGRVHAANPAAHRILDTGEGHLVGASIGSILPRIPPASDQPVSWEVMLHGRVVQVRSSPLLADDQTTSRRIIVLHDATDERASADLLVRYTDKLEQVNAELARVEQVRADLVAKVSHEIRTPMTVIRGVVQLAREGALSTPKGPELLEALERQVLRLTEQIDGLLSLSENTAAGEGQVVDVDLAAATRLVVEELGLPCAVWGEASAQAVPDHVARILRALFSNAVKYGGAPVRVHLRVEGGQAHVDVQDHGPGLDDSGGDPFDPFVQGSVGDRRTAMGLGIGLPVARRLARAAGGDLAVASRRDPTVLRLTLPTAPQRSAETVIPHVDEDATSSA